MFVVTVLFKIEPVHYGDFMVAIRANARASLDGEAGCRQFDVCEGEAADCAVFLYEVYDSPDDFSAHLRAVHFMQFSAQTTQWVKEKVVKTYTLQSNTVGSAEMRHGQ